MSVSAVHLIQHAVVCIYRVGQKTGPFLVFTARQHSLLCRALY